MSALTLLQAAVEYGTIAARSGGSGGSGGLDALSARWNAVVPFPPWVAGVALVAFWLLRPRSSGGGRGIVANALLVVGALAALYALARWRGFL